MQKYGIELPPEEMYPTLYDESMISKRPDWPHRSQPEKIKTTSQPGLFARFFKIRIRAKH